MDKKREAWLTALIAIGATALLGVVLGRRSYNPVQRGTWDSTGESTLQPRELVEPLAYRARSKTTFFQSDPEDQNAPEGREIAYGEAVYDGDDRFRLRTGASPGALNRSDLILENGEERHFSGDSMVLTILELEAPLPWWVPQHAPRETLEDQLEDIFVMPAARPRDVQQLLQEQVSAGLVRPLGTRQHLGHTIHGFLLDGSVLYTPGGAGHEFEAWLAFPHGIRMLRERREQGRLVLRQEVTSVDYGVSLRNDDFEQRLPAGVATEYFVSREIATDRDIREVYPALTTPIPLLRGGPEYSVSRSLLVYRRYDTQGFEAAKADYVDNNPAGWMVIQELVLPDGPTVWVAYADPTQGIPFNRLPQWYNDTDTLSVLGSTTAIEVVPGTTATLHHGSGGECQLSWQNDENDMRIVVWAYAPVADDILTTILADSVGSQSALR